MTFVVCRQKLKAKVNSHFLVVPKLSHNIFYFIIWYHCFLFVSITGCCVIKECWGWYIKAIFHNLLFIHAQIDKFLICSLLLFSSINSACILHWFIMLTQLLSYWTCYQQVQIPLLSKTYEIHWNIQPYQCCMKSFIL